MRTQMMSLIISLQSQVYVMYAVWIMVTPKTPLFTVQLTKGLTLLHARGVGMFTLPLIHSSDTSASSTSTTLQEVAQSPTSPNQLKTKPNKWWMKIRVQCTTFDRFPAFFLSSLNSYLWFCSNFTFFVYAHQLQLHQRGETIQLNKLNIDAGMETRISPIYPIYDMLITSRAMDFHRKYYHPSNARIWFYGDDDTNERLRILSEYLDLFDASPVSSESKIQPQILFSKPVRIIEKYPASEGAELKKKPLDLQTELALGFMDHLMLGIAASPLRKILLESGLGEAIVGGGIEDELLQPQFCIGLKGVSEEDIQKVEELVMTTLKSLAEEVFDLEVVEASMNTIEFSLSQNNTGSFPRGLSLMLWSMGKWIYDMDPFEPLKYEKPLASLKARIAKEGSKTVFSPLIEKFILNYHHLVIVEMQPDTEKASRYEAVEKEILDKVKAGMTEDDLVELARATQELRLKQETPDIPEVLRTVPSLSLHDIPKKPMRVPIEVGEIDGVKALKHDLFTNDALFTEIVFNMSSLRQELFPLVPLFCQSLLEMGTKDMDFVQLNRLTGRKTGGISVYPFTSSIRGREDPCSHMIVRGKAMAGRVDDLFHLVNCILQDVQFTDQQRFKQFVSQSKARIESAKKYWKIQLQEFNKKIVRVESRMTAVGRDIAWDVTLAELKVTTPLQGVKFTIFVPTNSSSTAHSYCILSQVLTKNPLLQIVVFTPETVDLSNQLNIDAGIETRILINVNALEGYPILKQLSTGVAPIYPVYATLVTSCALPGKEIWKIQLQEADRKKIVRLKCKMAALGRGRAWAERLADPGIGHIIHTVSLAKPIIDLQGFLVSIFVLTYSSSAAQFSVCNHKS